MREHEQKRLDRELAANGDPDAIARTARFPMRGNCECDQLRTRNRELTRQVEQLQQIIDGHERKTVFDDALCDVQEGLIKHLQAKVDAAEKLVAKWRHDADVIPDIEATADVESVIRRAADELEAALTAPPSSSDLGRADTGRQ